MQYGTQQMDHRVRFRPTRDYLYVNVTRNQDCDPCTDRGTDECRGQLGLAERNPTL